MNKFDESFIVFIIIVIFMLLLVFNTRIERLEDRVKRLEQVEEIKEVVNRGHGTGIGIGGSGHTFIDERIDIDMGMNMSHFSESGVDDRTQISNGGTAGRGHYSTTGRVDAIGDFSGKGSARTFYHISDPVWR